MRHPATYCWPPVLATLPIALAHVLAANRPEVFRQTHGFFEMAAVIGFLAAVVFSLRLWPRRRERSLRFALWLNLGFVVLVVGGAVSGVLLRS